MFSFVTSLAHLNLQNTELMYRITTNPYKQTPYLVWNLQKGFHHLLKTQEAMNNSPGTNPWELSILVLFRSLLSVWAPEVFSAKYTELFFSSIQIILKADILWVVLCMTACDLRFSSFHIKAGILNLSIESLKQ